MRTRLVSPAEEAALVLERAVVWEDAAGNWGAELVTMAAVVPVPAAAAAAAGATALVATATGAAPASWEVGSAMFEVEAALTLLGAPELCAEGALDTDVLEDCPCSP